MLHFFRKRKEHHEEAQAELTLSKDRLAAAHVELARRIKQAPDTMKRQERMRRILAENHLAELMYESFSEKRSQ